MVGVCVCVCGQRSYEEENRECWMILYTNMSIKSVCYYWLKAEETEQCVTRSDKNRKTPKVSQKMLCSVQFCSVSIDLLTTDSLTNSFTDMWMQI